MKPFVLLSLSGRLIAVACLSAWLSACGGGSGGTTSNPVEGNGGSGGGSETPTVQGIKAPSQVSVVTAQNADDVQ